LVGSQLLVGSFGGQSSDSRISQQRWTTRWHVDDTCAQVVGGVYSMGMPNRNEDCIVGLFFDRREQYPVPGFMADILMKRMIND
jgi:hypothetical protein